MSRTFELKSIGVLVRIVSTALAFGLLVSCVAVTIDQDDETEHRWSSPPDGSFVSVSVGWIHACGVRTDGSVFAGVRWAWRGQSGGRHFASVSAGTHHTCGVRKDGWVSCWGYGGHGQSRPPTSTFASVSAGGPHTCGIRPTGSVECWGSNGNWDDEFRGLVTPPTGSFTSISAGDGHTCGVRTDGLVACWGDDEYGQSSPPAGMFSSVSAEDGHTCRANAKSFQSSAEARIQGRHPTCGQGTTPGTGLIHPSRATLRLPWAYLWCAAGRFGGLLGRRWRGSVQSARRYLHIGQRGVWIHLWCADGWFDRLLGAGIWRIWRVHPPAGSFVSSQCGRWLHLRCSHGWFDRLPGGSMKPARPVRRPARLHRSVRGLGTIP